MNPQKEFDESCERGGIMGNMLNTLMNPEMHHQFLPHMNEELHDLWEEGEAFAQQDLESHWHNPPDPFDEAWQLSHPESLDSAWQTAEPSNDNPAHQLIIKELAGNILNSMSRQSDPKFQNSEFFKFAQKLYSGAAKIQDRQLVEDFDDVWTSKTQEKLEEPSIVDFENAWNPELGMQNDTIWNKLSVEEKAVFEEAWQKSREELEQMNEAEDQEKLMAEWNAAWASPTYQFAKENPWLGRENLYETALVRLQEGNMTEAIQMLEAELTSNPSNSAAWLLLGRTHSDLDNDHLAVHCFKSGLESDSFNLDHMLSLATCSMNLFDHSELSHLFQQWLANNYDYSGVLLPAGAPLEHVKEAFTSAIELNPNDPALYVCIGLMEFAENSYDAAEYFFEMANRSKPMDYDIINKLGVVLMKQGRNHEAGEYFKKAIELKPSFGKAWSNMAKNYTMINDYHNAVVCYLSAASIYPSDHLFETLRSTFVLMGREDLIENLQWKDPAAFQGEFKVVFPKPLIY